MRVIINFTLLVRYVILNHCSCTTDTVEPLNKGHVAASFVERLSNSVRYKGVSLYNYVNSSIIHTVIYY